MDSSSTSGILQISHNQSPYKFVVNKGDNPFELSNLICASLCIGTNELAGIRDTNGLTMLLKHFCENPSIIPPGTCTVVLIPQVQTSKTSRKRKRKDEADEEEDEESNPSYDNREILQEIRGVATRLETLAQGVYKQATVLNSLSKVIVSDCRPRPPSYKSERDENQTEMKIAARARYKCDHPKNPSLVKCMILGLYLPSNEICCSHIISVRNRTALARLGLPDEAIWNPKNCLLLFHEFEKRFENLEITFLLNPETQVFTLQVLNDKLLKTELSIPANTLFPRRKGNLTFRDVNGRPLLLPPLVFPYRRALYFVAKFAYEGAMDSNKCVKDSRPTEETWEKIKQTVVTSSECGDELAFSTIV